MSGPFYITGDPDADGLLADDPFALLIGMLLDQQVPIEWAFAAPARLRDRLGARFEPKAIAAMDPDELTAVFAAKPALHRYPASMAKRTYALATYLVERYDADTVALWRDVADGQTLLQRLRELPGFGDEKSKIFVALLGKRLGITPTGWAEACHPFSDKEPRSAADLGSAEALEAVRSWKKMMREAGRTKSDVPAT